MRFQWLKYLSLIEYEADINIYDIFILNSYYCVFQQVYECWNEFNQIRSKNIPNNLQNLEMLLEKDKNGYSSHWKWIWICQSYNNKAKIKYYIYSASQTFIFPS